MPARVRSRGLGLCVALAVGSLSGHVPAQTLTEKAVPPSTWSQSVERATEAGAYLPLSLFPEVGKTAALGAVSGGYDSAAEAPQFASFAEARIYGPFAARVGVSSNVGGEALRPSVAGRAQFLDQQRHGVMAAVALAFKAEGFTEPEGELETTLSVGRRFGRTLLLTNLIYGQDPEGRERDAEVSAACLVRLATWAHLGLDGRGRFDLSPSGTAPSREPRYAVDVGPVLNMAFGPLALSARAGLSSLARGEDDPRFGTVAMAGVGSAF
jgi:hypothetical protein